MTTGGAILAADFGSVYTRVVLIDVVDGTYQMLAHQQVRTTNGYPFNDVNVGLVRAVRSLEHLTGRQLLDPGQNIIKPEDAATRRGVDLFATTASAGTPLRAVIVGLMPDISLNTAQRAIAGAYIDTVATLHVRDERTDEERLNAIILNRPHLIFITGGTDRGAQEPLLPLLEATALALRLMEPEQRPAIIYAGNRRLQKKVEALLTDLAPHLVLAANVRPAITHENFEQVQFEVSRVYDQYRETGGAGFGKVGAMSSTGILPSAQSYRLITEYLMQTGQRNIIVADVGSTASVIVGAFRNEVSTYISTNIGLGSSAEQLLQTCGEATISEWLPYTPRAGELTNYALNKTLHPASIPLSQRDLYLEHAFLRAGMAHLVQEAASSWSGVDIDEMLPNINLVVVAGSALTSTGAGAFNMLLVADGIQPTGITEVKADSNGLLAAIGGLARHNAEAAVQLLDGDALEQVGTLVSIEGIPQPNRPALYLRILTDDGETIDQTIMGGQVLALPLPVGYSLKVRLRAARGLRIGGKRRQTVTLKGGTGGLLFDARGRQLVIGRTVQERAEQFPQWLSEVADIPLAPIPAHWLAARDDASDLLAEPASDLDDLFDLAPQDATASDLEDLFADIDDDEQDDAEEAKRQEEQRRKQDAELDEELGSLRDLL